MPMDFAQRARLEIDDQCGQRRLRKLPVVDHLRRTAVELFRSDLRCVKHIGQWRTHPNYDHAPGTGAVPACCSSDEVSASMRPAAVRARRPQSPIPPNPQDYPDTGKPNEPNALPGDPPAFVQPYYFSGTMQGIELATDDQRQQTQNITFRNVH